MPNPENFEAFAQVVTEDQVAQKIPCGPDVDRIVENVKKFMQAGFTEMSLVQIGPAQAEFCDFLSRELGPALRKL